jgi:hypothetical protein
MLAVVVDGADKKIHVFIDGKEPTLPEDLGDNTLDKVTPVYNSIGHSLFDSDPGLNGTIDELRVFDTPLTPQQIKTDFANGPNADPAGK